MIDPIYLIKPNNLDQAKKLLLKEDNRNLSEIKNVFKEYNQFDYIYLLNEVIFDLPDIRKDISLFIDYSFYSYYGKPTGLVSDISFKGQDISSFFTIKISHIFNVYDRVYSIQRFLAEFNEIFTSVLRELEQKLFHLESIIEFDLETAISYHSNDFAIGQKINLFRLINLSISEKFNIVDLTDSAYIENFIQDEILKSIFDIGTLSFNTQNCQNYFALLPIYSYYQWQEEVHSHLISCQNAVEFELKKKYFISSIKRFEVLTGLRYYYSSSGPSFSTKDLKRQINENYASISEIDINRQLKIDGKISINHRLILKSDYSQGRLLNLLVQYFKVKKINYDIAPIQSFVKNFTEVDKDQVGNVHPSKKLPETPLIYIDFIPKNLNYEFCQIFGYLSRNGIIKNSRTSLSKVLSTALSKKLKGFSESSIQKNTSKINLSAPVISILKGFN